MSKRPFAVLESDRDAKTVTYEASFWEGPLDAGRAGRYVRSRQVERWCDRKERDPFPWEPQGRKIIWLGRPLSTAPNVTYFKQLMDAFAKIGCRP